MLKLSRQIGELYRQLVPAGQFFWAPALVYLLLRRIVTLPSIERGEPMDWALYYATLAGCVAVVALTVALRWARHAMSWRLPSAPVHAAHVLQLAVLFYTASDIFGAIYQFYVTQIAVQVFDRLLLACMLATSLFFARESRHRKLDSSYLVRLFTVGMLLFVAVHVGFKLHHWPYSVPTSAFSLNSPFDKSALLRMSALVVLLWACLHLFRHDDVDQPALTIQQRWVNGWLLCWLAIVTFFIHGRIAAVPNWHPLIHWNAIYTPAMWVRQGSWLLWDTPMDYGSGLTLLLALLPFASLWNAVFYTHAFLQTLLTLLIYVLLQRSRYAFSPLIAYGTGLCATHFLYHLCFAPSYVTPAAGPMRFLWVYAGLVWCFALFQLREKWTPKKLAALRLAGIGLWILSIAWSAESGFFGSLVILPAFVLFGLMLRRPQTGDSLPRVWARSLIADAALLFVSLSLFGVALCVYYLLFLGYLPDFAMHFSVAMSYRHGFGSIMMNYYGSVQFQLLAGLMIMGSLAKLVLCNDSKNRTATYAAAALFCSCFLAIFSTSIYGINRSTDNVFANLSPITLVSLAMAWRAGLNIKLPEFSSLALRTVLAGYCACYLYISYDRWEAIRTEFNSSEFAHDINARVEDAEHPLTQITHTLHDKRHVSIEFFYIPFLPRQGYDFYQGRLQHWLPIGSYAGQEGTHLTPLSSGELAPYYERFVDRVCNREGFLVTRYEKLHKALPTIADILATRYRLESSVPRGDYFIQRYVRTAPCTLAPKPWIRMIPHPPEAFRRQ